MARPPVCKRCLLRDLTDSDYFQNIQDYIASLPHDSKTDAVDYERRLRICQACDNLVNGMCKLCGCFVEVRAAKKGNRCAMDEQRWEQPAPSAREHHAFAGMD